MAKSYAIGDIHGCNQTLHALLDQLHLQKRDRLIFLGDYMHRGPDTRGVFDTIRSLPAKGLETICLRGNHEDFFLHMLMHPYLLERWTLYGGEAVLQSFGIETPWEIPKSYLDFLQATKIWYETDGYICVHGGLDFQYENPFADRDSLLRIRHWYPDIDYSWLNGRTILHGHTPTALWEIQEQLQHIDQQQYLNLDNGCVYALSHLRAYPGTGSLLAFCLESKELFVQKNVE
ncbi:MAG: metallophosphoesterase family protein [Saprospiraceae bacterium]